MLTIKLCLKNVPTQLEITWLEKDYQWLPWKSVVLVSPNLLPTMVP